MTFVLQEPEAEVVALKAEVTALKAEAATGASLHPVAMTTSSSSGDDLEVIRMFLAVFD